MTNRRKLLVGITGMIAVSGCVGTDTTESTATTEETSDSESDNRTETDSTETADGTDSESPTESETEATGAESTQQLSGRLQIQSVVGSVTTGDSGNSVIGEVTLTVLKIEGAEDIALEDVTYEVVTSDTVTADVIAQSQISTITAETDDTIITDYTDRYQLTFDASSDMGGNIQSGETVQMILTTGAGASTVSQLRVPDSLIDRNRVAL